MKTNQLVITLSFVFYLLSPLASQAGGDKVKEKFKVWGNCGMCNEMITTAAKSVDGVLSAKWSAENQIMVVKFNSEKTTLDDIQKKIASVGYDTEKYKSKDEVYDKLHYCCQYDRN
jgi:periplasmic mercuric ion binding protein